jgi:iron complex outermembrane receptor protein
MSNSTCILRRAIVATMAGLCLARPVAAQQAPPDLATASIEDLMNLQVVSAGRRSQRAMDVPAAVHVITADEIRRSGLTSVPELLRLAPGVQVARIDASKWAIAIRGFNKRWSDKLLVLIDGRSIYNRQFSGVHWDSVNLMVEDIDRIEVVRGPGGSLWGANAVDGVINILTRSSADSQGTFARVEAGSGDRASGAVRHGGLLRAATYRASLNWSRTGPTLQDDDTESPDGWHAVDAGFRLDWKAGRDEVMVQTGAQRVDAASFVARVDSPTAPAGGWQPRPFETGVSSGFALGRWTRSFEANRSFEAQAFIDGTVRDDVSWDHRWTTVDAEIKYQTPAGAGHHVLAGMGYRRTRDHFHGSFSVRITPDVADLSVFNAYGQDEWRLASSRVRLTLGAKVEHETFSGWGVQPTARLLWAPAEHQRVWAAVSRALRTPARADRGLRVNVASFPGERGLPVVVALMGNGGYRTENMTSVEAGYRVERRSLSMEAAVFTGRHEGLQTLEPIDPHVETTYGAPNLLVGQRFDNLMDAESRGIELTGRWNPRGWAHVDGSYVFFDVSSHPDAASRDPHAASYDGAAPRHQWQLRPGWSAGSWTLDVAVQHVGGFDSREVPAYSRTDARVEWAPSRAWSLSLTGQNLFSTGHREFGGDDNATAVGLDPRRVIGRVAWRF